MLKSLCLSVLFLFSVLNIAQAENIAIPSLNGRITDLSSTLSTEQKNHIEQVLTELEKSEGSQLAVLIVSTTKPESIEDYSMRVVEKWKLGRKNIDDGVLLLIASNDRKIRIEVGYGLEGAIPDISAGRIINEFITPEFRRGRFYEGVLAGVGQLSNLIKGEALPAPRTTQGVRIHYGNGMDSIIYILIFLSVLLRALLGRLVTSVMVTLGGALVVWFFTHNLLFVFFAAIVLGLLSFLPNSSGGSTYRNGSSGGSSGGSFSSGGGFSGGGGSFGGGGASGGW